MTPERWQQIQTVLHAAIAVPAAERGPYVAGACAGDADLLREVESLLDHLSGGSGFLSTPVYDIGGGALGRESLVGRQLGRYTVQERLGSGGMGEVYRAEDTQLRRAVALKALHDGGIATPEGRQRLLREAQAVAALNHPSIAAIYDLIDVAADAGTPPHIVMEYVPGETLSARLKEGPLPVAEALRIAKDIADALAATHRQGIIHRDLKPANLQLTTDGRVKVLDFGLARKVSAPVETTGATTEAGPLSRADHRIAGTPGYMSPEQGLGRPIGTPTDVFSLGIVLFEMLTGHRPYPGDDFLPASLSMIGLRTPRIQDSRPEVEPAVDELVTRMLAMEPAGRPSASDVVNEIDALLRSPGTTVGVGTPPRSRLSRRRLAVSGGVIVILAATIFIARDPLRRRLGIVPSGPPPRISLALLPVDTPAGDVRAEAEAASLTAVIGGNFGSIPRVTVLSRAVTSPYQKDTDGYVSLQRALGATHVLKLSWRSVDPVLKVEAQLFQPGIPQPEWTGSFRGDALSIEQDVLVALRRTFERSEPHRRFTSEEWDRLGRLPTTSGAALTAYADARALLDRPSTDVDRAIGLLQQATTLDPQFVFAWAALGDAFWGQYTLVKDASLARRATESLRTALSIDPDSAPVNSALGEMQLRTGDPASAEASFRRALQLQPDFDAAQRGLAQVLAGSGRVDEAETVMRQAISFNRSWNNFFMMGTIDYRAGRYESAADAFVSATQATPNNGAAYTMLGNTQYILGNLQQAVGNFEHAVRLGPTRAAYANLALSYYDTGRFEDALHSYEEALRRDPRSVDTHRNIGDVDQRLGRTRQARAEYERAVALGNEMLAVNPRDVRTMGMVALCEAKLGQRAGAERHASEAVAVDSSSREAWQRSAEVHALLHQPDAALRDLEIAIARGFEPRMARRDEELGALRRDSRFEDIVKKSSSTSTRREGALP